ncbi:MAG: DUF3298 domain-containing protein [Crocinitomicaceae bacterium]|nr:DUF3298 domain-containing protein [Crocinitomicaceae bacterium]
MKFLLPTAFFVSAFLLSCSSSRPVIEEGITTIEETEMFTGGEARLMLYSSDRADSLESSIDYMFYSAPNKPYQDSVNKIVKSFVAGTVSNGEEIAELQAELSKKYFQNAIDIFGNWYNTELAVYDDEDDYFGGVWQTLTSASIYEDNPEFVEVGLGNWEYTGGAHGNGWSEQRIIEIATGKELMLRDFFKDIGDLCLIAEDIFRADQEIQHDQTLSDAGFWFEDDIFVLNENFVFNENSVDFLFNQYEIASYAAGAIVLSIPMDKVKHLLKRKVKF